MMRRILQTTVVSALMIFSGYSVCYADNDDYKAIGHVSLDLIPRYNYEFDYLPTVASQITDDTAEQLLSTPELVNSTILKNMGYVSPFSDYSIKITKEKVGDKDVYVWQLPEPEEVTNCKFIAFVPRSDGEGYRMFTLEKSILVPWVVGEAGGANIHTNYGDESGDVSTADDFIKLLKKKKLL